MGWFDWITGGGKTAEKVVDGVSSGLDAMFFTDEEKSQANQKILDWKLKYFEATKSSNVTRRVIALMIVGLWVVLVVGMVISHGFGAVAYAEYLFKTLTDIVMQPFSIIIGFYFLAHVVRANK